MKLQIISFRSGQALVYSRFILFVYALNYPVTRKRLTHFAEVFSAKTADLQLIG